MPFCIMLINKFPQECQSGTRLILVQEGPVSMNQSYKCVHTTKPRSVKIAHLAARLISAGRGFSTLTWPSLSSRWLPLSRIPVDNR